MPYAVEFYPPGREDVHVFTCREKPTYRLNEEAEMHTLMLMFVPTNGSQRGKTVSVPAGQCLVAADGPSAA